MRRTADCGNGQNKGWIQIFWEIQSAGRERKWTALDGKQLQTVLEKLDITREIEAAGEVDTGGNELWSVSYFLNFPRLTPLKLFYKNKNVTARNKA